MSRDERSTTSHPRVSKIRARKPGLSRSAIITRLLIVGAVMILLIVAAGLLYQSFNQRGSSTSVAIDLPVSGDLNPFEAAALGFYLTNNANALETAAGTDATLIVFEVPPGSTANQVAENLEVSNLISDAQLFNNYLRYYGLDRRLEAGTYQLSATMTIPEIAFALTDAAPPEIIVRITEGWRREQIADYLDLQPDVPFTGAEFLAVTGPGAVIPTTTTLTGILPAASSLEGFLFPDTYRLAIDSSATELVEKMLINFDTRVTEQMRLDAAAKGYSLYQIMIIASIVEREAVVADERATIASVYLNRLERGIKLEADPTVQYAMGYQAETGQWWNLALTQFDYSNVDSVYNTYLYVGLPPTPIASPGIDSITAVIYSADTPYFFFRAACDGSGRHRFAITFEEHLANAC